MDQRQAEPPASPFRGRLLTRLRCILTRRCNMPAAKKPKKAAPELAFNHAMIYVRDVAVALQFYKDLLGFKLIEQYGPSYARLRATKGQGSSLCTARKPISRSTAT